MLDWPPLEEFAQRLGGQRRAIKALLLDQVRMRMRVGG